MCWSIWSSGFSLWSPVNFQYYLGEKTNSISHVPFKRYYFKRSPNPTYIKIFRLFVCTHSAAKAVKTSTNQNPVLQRRLLHCSGHFSGPHFATSYTDTSIHRNPTKQTRFYYPPLIVFIIKKDTLSTSQQIRMVSVYLLLLFFKKEKTRKKRKEKFYFFLCVFEISVHWWWFRLTCHAYMVVW